MVQTVHSVKIPPGHKLLIIEKPLVLCRIFFSVCVFVSQAYWYESQISFGDPSFRSYYILNGPGNYFEAKGEGIFQGDIWVRNVSNVNLRYTVSEILV